VTAATRVLGLGATLLLWSCGDSGSGLSALAPVVPPPTVPLAAEDAPVIDVGGHVHVGSAVQVAAGQLTPGPRHGAAGVSHGRVRDGFRAVDLLAYLHEDATALLADSPAGDPGQELLPDGLLLRFRSVPPIVRVARGARPEWIDETVQVVQLLNADLPPAWQIGVDREPGSAGPMGLPEGEILVEFAPQSDWPLPDGPVDVEEIGAALPRYGPVPTGNPAMPVIFEIVGGQVWIDPTRTHGNERLGVIAHELLHVLGRQHPDPGRFPETIMLAGGGDGPTRHILHPIDREALLAVYGRFATSALPDTLAENLGHWSDTSDHVLGALGMPGGAIRFGTGLRNGLLQPWATGPGAGGDLARNASLAGPARWMGRLLGLTPEAEVVAGAAELVVDLPALTGRLAFTELESWSPNGGPGAAGTGRRWLDGDLSYRAVQVDGGYEDMSPDAPIRIDAGAHAATGPSDPQISWHEVPLQMLYVDEARSQPFSGVIDPAAGMATGDDGQTYTSLHGMAVESGAPLTMAAFRRGLSPLGDWGHYIVVLSVLLFAISTAIAWSYYGDRCANYLFGAKAVIPYKVIFVILHFVGAVLPLSVIWDIGDVFLSIVIWPNLIALGILAPQVVEMTRDYFERKPWRNK